MWHSFVCAMVAAVSLQAMNPFRTGKLVLWQVSYERNWHDFEVLSFILIGLMGVTSLTGFTGSQWNSLLIVDLGDLWGGIFEDEYESGVLEETFLGETLSYFGGISRGISYRLDILSQHLHSVLKPPPLRH